MGFPSPSPSPSVVHKSSVRRRLPLKCQPAPCLTLDTRAHAAHDERARPHRPAMAADRDHARAGSLPCFVTNGQTSFVARNVHRPAGCDESALASTSTSTSTRTSTSTSTTVATAALAMLAVLCVGLVRSATVRRLESAAVPRILQVAQARLDHPPPRRRRKLSRARRRLLCKLT